MNEQIDSVGIIVWRFSDAPEKFRKLSGHGGDEDWLALVPASYSRTYIPWLEYGPFGVCDISSYDLENGQRVCIGAHA